MEATKGLWSPFKRHRKQPEGTLTAVRWNLLYFEMITKIHLKQQVHKNPSY